MDVKIKDAAATFNYCVRAIIVQDGKVLTLCTNDAGYAHLPGGHVEIGETSTAALKREIKEELGWEIMIDRLVITQEQLYQKQDQKHHSLLLYYLAQPKAQIELNDSIHMEQGRTKMIKHALHWVALDALPNFDLRPVEIKNLIMQNDWHELRHIIS